MRSKGAIGLLIIVLLIAFGGCVGCATRGNLVEQEEVVKQTWGDVENQYQRRADLVPNLVAAVQRAENFEQGVIESVRTAQTEASGSKVGLSELNDSGKLRRYMQAQSQLGEALNRLLNDAEVRAMDAFLDLQTQLEGAENRIAVARRNYNKAVAEFNKMTRTFPGMLIPGFSPKMPFEAQEGAENAPSVNFK
jgi:LemA protein